mmetsp:Transcript_7547/g.16454  ORF Transcript_7547/g.16454 Transcript_7547/m.16454 type:complete len:531 (-) Transcript_7547:19-1611(-)
MGTKKIVAALMATLFLKSSVWRVLVYKLKNRPPGPIPFPIIGNFPYLSPPNTPPGIHKDFYKLFKAYGPVYSLWFGANYGIVLNSREAFYEALKTKQDEYAKRPVLKSFEAITHGQGVAMNNGKRWRMIRTVMQTHITNKQKGVEAEDMLKEEIGSSLAWLNDQCARGHGADFDLRQLCRREALNVIMRKIFSFRFGDANTPLYMEVQDWIRVIFEHLAQGSPSDFMPIAKYFPNSEEDHYRGVCFKMEAFIDGEIARHRKTAAKADPENADFIHSMIRVQQEAKAKGAEFLTDVDIRVVAWDSMAGAIDTSATTMEWLIYVLINHKPVLRKLQRILDEVVGPDRLPGLEDIEKLEYLTAILDEIFRFKHFAPQGLPHEAAVDTSILGYNVPKGTQVFFNYYSLHMNPKYWKKPEEFRPERFLEEERSLLNTCLHPEMNFSNPEAYKFVPFGQGRRRCVGYGFGRIAMWIKAALWLHCFDWDSVDGKPMDIDSETLGITMVPNEQKVKAIPRPAARLLKSIDGNPKFDQR